VGSKKSGSALVVSAPGTAALRLSEIISPVFSNVSAACGTGEAMAILEREAFDLVIINAPLSGDFSLAVHISEKTTSSPLLLARGKDYDAALEKLEPLGVFTLPKPVSPSSVLQSARLILAARAKICMLSERETRLKSSMEDLRMVNRAKLILMEHLKMTEAEAHRYIEKQAMDFCIKRRSVAENIIRTYED